jgi:hypothetical protein
MPLSRVTLFTITKRKAASKPPASRWRRICALQYSPLSATHPTAKRCFGSHCHEAAPDHSPTALPA